MSQHRRSDVGSTLSRRGRPERERQAWITQVFVLVVLVRAAQQIGDVPDQCRVGLRHVGGALLRWFRVDAINPRLDRSEVQKFALRGESRKSSSSPATPASHRLLL